jgi:hypothetical protein
VTTVDEASVPAEVHLHAGPLSAVRDAADHPAFQLAEYAFLRDYVVHQRSNALDKLDAESDVLKDSRISLGEVLKSCPRARYRGTLSDPCGAQFCPFCMPRVSTRISGALGLAEPDLLLTVTLLPPDWLQIRRLLNALMASLRRRSPKFQWAYTVEANRSGDRAHAHAWVRGPRLRRVELADIAASAGVGSVHQVPTFSRGQALGYTLKEVGLSPTLPVGEALAQQATFWHLNGGRLVHATHGFWRDRDGAASTLRRAKRLGRGLPFPQRTATTSKEDRCDGT